MDTAAAVRTWVDGWARAWPLGDASAVAALYAEDVRFFRAAVDWWAVITTRDGVQETVAGTSLLRFAEDGRVVAQRDAWASQEGRHELPHWATD